MKRESEKKVEEIIAKNSPNLITNINLQIQEVQQTPSMIKRSTLRCIKVKKLKAKGKKENLEISKKKKKMTHHEQGNKNVNNS